MIARLGPPLRIRRRTAWERRHLPRILANATELLEFSARPGDLDVSRLASSLLHSPYYLEILRAAGLSPRDLGAIDDLRHFPTLDRATLGARWRDFPDLRDGPDAVVVLSSGTTGDPVRVVRDGYDTLYMWAVLRFFLLRLDVQLPPRPRVVLLDSLPSGLEYSVRLRLVGQGAPPLVGQSPTSLPDGALHRISIFRPRALERLRRAQPSVIFSDPAGLHWLAGQPQLPGVRLLLTSAQRLSWHQRAAFTAPIVNYYSTTETGPLAWECLQVPERFHVLAPDVWLESVAGELVVTRLRASILPLLRYRTGDAGSVEPDICLCGFQGWTVSNFSGRGACRFRTPQGLPVDAWQLAWLFKAYPLSSFRLTQTSLDSFQLEMDYNPGPDLIQELTEALRRLGWPNPSITVRSVRLAPQQKPEPFQVMSSPTSSIKHSDTSRKSNP